jgi:TP901-1 family phage major tail protein
MAAQKGSALLIKIGSGSPEAFTTVGGLRSTSISLNDEAVDVTTMDSSNNRTLLPNGGIQSMSISGSGVFTDAASETALKTAFGASTFSNYQFIVPMDSGETGTYEGAFMISSLEYSGEYNGEVTYSVTLESSGAVTYTVA